MPNIPISQTGNITPGHVVTWATDGVAQDGGPYPQVVAFGTPASSSAAAVQGQLLVDASYLYVATATNTWKRLALSSF